MGNWNSSPHPISDLKDWNTMGRIEVRPSFQRQEVWNPAARIMLIDTILRRVPMPKIFLWNEVMDDHTHRKVIDGQQRVSAILAFLRDGFALDEPYNGPFKGKKFSELPTQVRTDILQYKIDYNEATGFSEEEIREVYSRVNKYSLPLNRQELRRADFPGDFLDLATELSLGEYLDYGRVFTIAQRRRMLDVEFVSELLAGMLEGPQEKKGDLNYFYGRYASWTASEKSLTNAEFNSVINDLQQIFTEDDFPISKTRFRQKSDFYSLFLSINDFHRLGYSLGSRSLDPLRLDLRILDQNIKPESTIDLLSEYAIKCVSQANSAGSRAWRRNFLTSILGGSYRARLPDHQSQQILEGIASQLAENVQGSLFSGCVGCGRPINMHTGGQWKLSWQDNADVFQISNACWRAAECESESSHG